jgi:hypothetical protein
MDNLQIENTISEIRKRSGVVTAFNKDKISNAISITLQIQKIISRLIDLKNKIQNRLLIVEHPNRNIMLNQKYEDMQSVAKRFAYLQHNDVNRGVYVI